MSSALPELHLAHVALSRATVQSKFDELVREDASLKKWVDWWRRTAVLKLYCRAFKDDQSTITRAVGPQSTNPIETLHRQTNAEGEFQLR